MSKSGRFKIILFSSYRWRPDCFLYCSVIIDVSCLFVYDWTFPVLVVLPLNGFSFIIIKLYIMLIPDCLGTTIAEEHSPSSSVPSSGEAISSVTAASPSPSSSAPRTASLGSRGDQSILGRADARSNSMGNVERRIMQEMPGVFTSGLPNGNRVEGFLYKYRKGEGVRIVCICHGSFHTPSEFVEHAGAGKVDNPLRHIVVSPSPNLWTFASRPVQVFCRVSLQPNVRVEFDC